MSRAPLTLKGAQRLRAELEQIKSVQRPAVINADFTVVRTVMPEMGLALMGSGSARGADRAPVGHGPGGSGRLLR